MPIEAKLNYYPAIVSVEDWTHMRDRRVAWAEHHKATSRRTVANILARLARCPKCGRSMILMRNNIPNRRYLTCMAWREGRACSDEWVRFPEIEDVFLSDINHLNRQCRQPQMDVAARASMLKTISRQLAHLRSRLKREREANVLVANNSRGGRSWWQQTEDEIERVLGDRYRLRLDRNYWEGATLSLKLEALRKAVLAEPRDLARINDKLRSLLVRVVVDWEHDRLILHWRHGGQSVTKFWRRRQKGGPRNVTPDPGPRRRKYISRNRWRSRPVSTT